MPVGGGVLVWVGWGVGVAVWTVGNGAVGVGEGMGSALPPRDLPTAKATPARSVSRARQAAAMRAKCRVLKGRSIDSSSCAELMSVRGLRWMPESVWETA